MVIPYVDQFEKKKVDPLRVDPLGAVMKKPNFRCSGVSNFPQRKDLLAL